MDEIEVKILDIDRKAVEKRLADLGFRKAFDGEVVTLFFDFPDSRIREAGDMLRLRRKGEASSITYKKKLAVEGAKVMREHEAEISDFEAMCNVLASIGLERTLEVAKRRTSYRKGRTSVEIDSHTGEYSYIPEFLEIEAESTAELARWVEAMGYKMEEARPWSFFQVALHYRR